MEADARSRVKVWCFTEQDACRGVGARWALGRRQEMPWLELTAATDKRLYTAQLQCLSPELPLAQLLPLTRAKRRCLGESTGESQHRNPQPSGTPKEQDRAVSLSSCAPQPFLTAPRSALRSYHGTYGAHRAGPGHGDTYVVDGVLQVEDPVLDGVADVVLRVHHGRG